MWGRARVGCCSPVAGHLNHNLRVNEHRGLAPKQPPQLYGESDFIPVPQQHPLRFVSSLRPWHSSTASQRARQSVWTAVGSRNEPDTRATRQDHYQLPVRPWPGDERLALWSTWRRELLI